MTDGGADRNLLFGILALQMDFISQEQLIAATSVWMADKSRDLEDILVQQSALSPPDRDMLVPLVDRHIANHDGDATLSLAALSSIGSIREQIKSLGDPEIEETLARSFVADSASSPDSLDETILKPTSVTDTPVGSATAVPQSGSRFRILRPHARGGLGEVSVAVDVELNREVALKEIQNQFADNVDSRSRFVLEAEVTGGLEHPGIVPVYGLGQYDDGRPYYAMRFIRGDSLQEAADRFHAAKSAEKGSQTERVMQLRNLLRRFVDVCEAIDYAHSRGVLHRDLKPGNIMLGKYGETLVVDWGLAKIAGREEETAAAGETTLQPSAESGSAATQMGRAIGTPAYMPPEQAGGRLDELGCASDVYSLGATLYYLITGQPPIKGKNVLDVLQKVQAGDIQPPRSVCPDVAKPIEAICLKAMSVDPKDRYASCRELADDVERFLADEPVTAQPEPIHVRAKRWMRKHPTPVAATAATILVGLVSAVSIAVIVAGKNDQLETANSKLDASNSQLSQSNRALEVSINAERKATAEAEQQRDRAKTAEVLAKSNEQEARQQEAAAKRSAAEANAVLEFFEGEVLAAARPKSLAGGLGVDVTIRDAIDAAVPKIDQSFQDQPLVEASLRNTLGATYEYLGEPELSIAQHERAIELRTAHLGPEHPKTLRSMNDLSVAYQAAGRLDDALQISEEVVQLRKIQLGPEDPETLISMNNLAGAYHATGRLDDSARLLEEILRIQKKVIGPKHRDTLQTMANLAVALGSVGRLADALPINEEVVRLRKEILGPKHRDTLRSIVNLAAKYREMGRPADALPLYEASLQQTKVEMGPDHPDTLTAMSGLAGTYVDMDRVDEALPLYEETLRLRKIKQGPEHPDTLGSMNNLALGYSKAGRVGDALPLYEEAARLLEEELGADHPDTLTSMGNLSLYYGRVGRIDDALPLAEETLQRRKAKLGPDHPATITSMNNVASIYHQAKRMKDALSLYEEALRLAKENWGPEHPNTLEIMGSLVSCYLLAGRSADALPILENLLALKKTVLGQDHPSTLSTMLNLANALKSARRLNEALPLMKETLRLREKTLGLEHPDTLTTMDKLAGVHRAAGQLDKAISLYEETIRLRKEQLGPEHPQTTISMNNLAVAYLSDDRPGDALPLLEDTFRILKETFGPDHANTQAIVGNLIRAYELADRTDEALALKAEKLRLKRKQIGPEHRDTLFAISNLAMGYLSAGRPAEAVPLFEEASQLMKKSLGPEHSATLTVMKNLTKAYFAVNRVDDAIPLCDSVLSGYRKQAGENDAKFASTLASVSVDLLKHGQYEIAEPYLRESLAIREKAMPDHWLTASTQSMLGGALLGQRKFDAAEPLLIAGYEAMQQHADEIPEQGKIRFVESVERLVELYTALEKPDEAARWKEKLEPLKSPTKSK